MNQAGRAYLTRKDLVMNRTVLLALGALLTTPLSVQAASSIYTDASIDKCENLISKPEQVDIDMGTISVKCPGYKGYPFYFSEYDVR